MDYCGDLLIAVKDKYLKCTALARFVSKDIFNKWATDT